MFLIFNLLFFLNMLFVIINFILIVKFVVFCFKKKENVIYYTRGIFWLSFLIYAFLCPVIIMLSFDMYWINEGIDGGFIFYLIFTFTNLLIAFGFFISSKKIMTINEKDIIIHRFFTKRKILFEEINISKSKYVFVFPKNKAPILRIFNHDEYLWLELFSGESVKVNLHPFKISEIGKGLDFAIDLHIKRVKE